MSTETDRAGWQAMLEIDGMACETREQADDAALRLGWTVQEEIEACDGLWMCTITADDVAELDEHGFVERDAQHGEISIRGWVELP